MTVDGRRYRYAVSDKGEDQGCRVQLVVTVQDDEANGAHLRVSGLLAWRNFQDTGNYLHERMVDRPVEPGHVAGMIRLGISRGWKLTQAGRAFVLRVEDLDAFDADEAGSRAE